MSHFHWIWSFLDVDWSFLVKFWSFSLNLVDCYSFFGRVHWISSIIYHFWSFFGHFHWIWSFLDVDLSFFGQILVIFIELGNFRSIINYYITIIVLLFINWSIMERKLVGASWGILKVFECRILVVHSNGTVLKFNSNSMAMSAYIRQFSPVSRC